MNEHSLAYTSTPSGVTSIIGSKIQNNFSVQIAENRLSRKDEAGQLARAFDKTQRNIRTLLQQVMNSVEQLAAAAEEMTFSAEQSSQAANQVAGSISHMASGANKQLNAAANTSNVIGVMTECKAATGKFVWEPRLLAPPDSHSGRSPV
jgi:methyl-accepting chemotaxis protein